MSDVKKAAEEYVTALRKEHRIEHDWQSLVTFDFGVRTAYLAGAAWQREVDAKIAEEIDFQTASHGCPYKCDELIAKTIRNQEHTKDSKDE